LEAEERKFDALVKHAPFAALVVDEDFRVREISRAALPSFGNIPDPIGRKFAPLIPLLWPNVNAEEMVDQIRQTLETGEPFVNSEYAGLPSGLTECRCWSIERIRLPGDRRGVVLYFDNLPVPITHTQKTARPEERFRALSDASLDAVYHMNADWSELRHLRGRNFIEDTGAPTDAWLEKYIHPDDRPLVLSAIDRAIRTRSVYELEHRVIRKDGMLGWALSRAIPGLNSEGEISEWFGTAKDITNRKATEAALEQLIAQSEQERRLYQTILSGTPDLVYVFDLDHRFTYANQALLTLWGKTAEEAIGKNCLELGYEPWHAAMHDREIDQVIATKKPIRGDVPFAGTLGPRIYDYIFVPVCGLDGEVEAIAGTTRDVTDRHLTEQELRRANQDLEQFAYAATHDLQEPLRSVRVYSELLERRYAERLDGQALEFLAFVRSGAMRMEMLIRDLLSYTQAGRSEPDVEPANAEDCLEAALANLQTAIDESGAQIFSESLPLVMIHRTHLQQVLQNLIGNAIKYRRPGVAPTVHISARSEDGHWHFTVADNGIGIEDQYKQQVFGLFKRLHTQEKYSGTGIGLALCQRIVERNHGRIWVESEPGKGSRFHFTLRA
jgi:hypothetical protein